ncbi:MAG: hypothetical protein ACOC56_06410 [Atribacterota bacterium]
MSKDYELKDINNIKTHRGCPKCGEKEVAPISIYPYEDKLTYIKYNSDSLTETIVKDIYLVLEFSCPKCNQEWREYFKYYGYDCKMEVADPHKSIFL